MKKKRCWGTENILMTKYHDEEWGDPVHDDTKLFEFLILEGIQAGLSWQTILNRRENYRIAFDHFDYKKIALYDEIKLDLLLNDRGIIRNKLKIKAAITNAKAFIQIQDEYGSFDEYVWSFIDNKPIINEYKDFKDVPSKTELSEDISKDLKRRGFKFVGPTIIYAFMQAIGMVNDHLIQCYRYQEINKK
ncbi:MAG: DNA-3-methyladenine glycosylase I [Candidatus Lokiarchaeota archaeon]|nr:DNA-3-methyladenine glycosylase I [Candidatus Lokiarchaeota archaeon]